MKRVALLCEVLHPPLDEGIRAVAAEIARALARSCELLVAGEREAELRGLHVRGLLVDRYFAGRALAEALTRFAPEAILYVPWTSLTPRTFFRVFMLKRRSGGVPVGVVSLQPRGAGWLARLGAALGPPDRLFGLGPEVERQAARLGLACHRLRGGVDPERFAPIDPGSKADLRRSLGLPSSPYLVLHVGHLKRSRGVECLGDVQRLPGVQALLITSTSTRAEEHVRRRLQAAGVRVIDRQVERIQDFYRAADCYLFPVTSALDAIELPLSVLEAMACNLPVISTKFGGVPSLLNGEISGVRLVDSVSELSDAVKAWATRPPSAALREKVISLSWDAMAGRILESLTAAARGAAFRSSEIRE